MSIDFDTVATVIGWGVVVFGVVLSSAGWHRMALSSCRASLCPRARGAADVSLFFCYIAPCSGRSPSWTPRSRHYEPPRFLDEIGLTGVALPIFRISLRTLMRGLKG
jgi:hypothetical protein